MGDTLAIACNLELVSNLERLLLLSKPFLLAGPSTGVTGGMHLSGASYIHPVIW
jgi:hypothetical protein